MIEVILNNLRLQQILIVKMLQLLKKLKKAHLTNHTTTADIRTQITI